ncbi:MAG: CpsB/CapC family capsule biosynthesis tyrosine phosphatase [Actinomycetota bacterium]
MGFFVDVHSHVVPSGDDGAQGVVEGRGLCREAAAHGTAILYATPHVWPHLTLTEAREREIRANFAEVAEQAGLELRLGFELTPAPPLLDQDLSRYTLEGTNAVLIEVPFTGSEGLLIAICERMETQQLQPVIAHPERTQPVLERPSLARELAERGWLLQVNGSSLTARHGPEIEALAWGLVDDGLVSLVGSDGHRGTRPARLDDAYAAAVTRVGETQARSLFDGSAIGVVASTRQLPSRAAAQGA